MVFASSARRDGPKNSISLLSGLGEESGHEGSRLLPSQPGICLCNGSRIFSSRCALTLQLYFPLQFRTTSTFFPLIFHLRVCLLNSLSFSPFFFSILHFHSSIFSGFFMEGLSVSLSVVWMCSCLVPLPPAAVTVVSRVMEAPACHGIRSLITLTPLESIASSESPCLSRGPLFFFFLFYFLFLFIFHHSFSFMFLFLVILFFLFLFVFVLLLFFPLLFLYFKSV